MGLVSFEVAEHDLEPGEECRLEFGLSPVQPGVHLSLLLVVGALQVEVGLGNVGQVSHDGVRGGDELAVNGLHGGLHTQRTLVL